MRLGILAFGCALLFGMAGASARDWDRDRDGWRDGGRHYSRDHDHRRWDRDHRHPVYVAPRAYYVAPPVYQPPTFSFTPGAGISIYLPFR